jgi:hypothetical protein
MKSQVSTEFLILVSILLTIAIILLSSTASIQNQVVSMRMYTEAKKLSDKIAFEINSAAKSGMGYKRKFYVEDSFFGVSDFNITVKDFAVSIVWDKGSTNSQIIIKNITGNISKGWNLIENIDGVIYVS